MFESTFKNFNLDFNNLNASDTVSSGDVLTGHISFDLTKETMLKSITMTLTGGARFPSTCATEKNRRNGRAAVTFFDVKTALLQRHGGLQLLHSSSNCAVEETDKLPPGTHVYPFTCQIPQGDFPSTYHGPVGHIEYTLTVGMNRPRHRAKTFRTDLNFKNHIDPNQPDLRAPLSGWKSVRTCNLWCSSGEVTVAARTEKKAFIPGETVKVICDFSNGSTKTATPKVKLLQKQALYTINRVPRGRVFKELASVIGDHVTAHTFDQHAEILIKIPSSASLSITNCTILEVEYLLQVSLCVKPCTDVTVLFPIVLCDTPVEACPPL